jgi:hypothetical protein
MGSIITNKPRGEEEIKEGKEQRKGDRMREKDVREEGNRREIVIHKSGQLLWLCSCFASV